MIDLWKRSDELLFISSSIEKTPMRALGEGAAAEGEEVEELQRGK